MSFRKTKNAFRILLAGMLALILLSLGLINLPFALKYATARVNGVFESTRLPIHIHSIGYIKPKAVAINGVTILGVEGDTVIQAEEVKAEIRLLALLKRKVTISSASLEELHIRLSRPEEKRAINIAETFTVNRDKSQKNKNKPWEVSVGNLIASTLSFQLLDSVAGVFIQQEADHLKLKTDLMSIPEKTLLIQSLQVKGANGSMKTCMEKNGEKNENSGTWNFGLKDLVLADVHFLLDNPIQRFALDLTLDDAQLKTKKTDINNRSADINKASVSGLKALIKRELPAAESEEIHPPGPDPFLWDIACKSLGLEHCFFGISQYQETGSFPDETHFNIQRLSLKLSEIRLNPETVELELKRLAFDLHNGFSVKKAGGTLQSRQGETQLNLQLESGNSQLNLEVGAAHNIFDMLAGSQRVHQASLSLFKSRLSLKDLEYFDLGLSDQAFPNALTLNPFAVSGGIRLRDSALLLSDVSISQAKAFSFTANGGDGDSLQFSLSEINTRWLNELLKEMGAELFLPPFDHLAMEGMLRDATRSPDLTLGIKSDVGVLNLTASYEIGQDSLRLTSEFEQLWLDRIFNDSALGSYSGYGEFLGHGIREKSITGAATLFIDSLTYHGYRYRRGEIHATLLPRKYELRCTMEDPALGLDLTARISTDSLLAVKTRGSFRANTHELNLMKDTLALEGKLTASLLHGANAMEAFLSLSDLTFTTPTEKIHAGPLKAALRSDSLHTDLSGRAAYFNMDLKVGTPVDSLKTILPAYRSFAASFLDTLTMKQSLQNTHLPATQARLALQYHPAYEVLLRGLYFDDLNIAIDHSPPEKRLQASLLSRDIRYKMLELGRLDTRITDSAGTIQLELAADSTMIFSHPANRLRINSQSAKGQSQTKLAVIDEANELVYGLEVQTQADSSDIHVLVPSKQLTMNRTLWQMSSEDLLSYNLMQNKLYPDLEMFTANSRIKLFARGDEHETLLTCELSKLNVGTLLPEHILTGNPGGQFSGSLSYYEDEQQSRELRGELDIHKLSWWDLYVENLHLESQFNAETPKGWALEAYSTLDSAEIELEAEKTSNGFLTMKAALQSFPLYTAQPFIKDHITELDGTVSGSFSLSSGEEVEDMQGELTVHQGHLRINTLNSAYRIPEERVSFNREKILLDHFTVLDSTNNKLLVNGFIDLTDPSSISTDLDIQSSDLQVMNRQEKDSEYFFGQIFVNSRLAVTGPLSNPDLRGRILLTGDTEVFFRNREDLSLSDRERIITFVSDTGIHDELNLPLHETPVGINNSTVKTLVEIDPQTRIHFKLSQKMYRIDLMIQGGGALNYGLLENNQMNLTGKYEIGEGTADMKITGWPNKMFRISPGAYISWDGNVEDPILNLQAVNQINTSYTNPVDGQIRNVEFNVVLNLADRLSELDMIFTINTPDQYLMSIINTLSPEEKMRQAVTTLLFERIDLPGVSNSTDYVTQQVNQILASQLNELTKTTIKGIDISFGIDTYTASTSSGGEQTNTSLSYDVQKAVLNDRGKIEVSGRVNDFSNQQNNSNISLNNVSFEYQLDSVASKFIKVYNEHSYEDVFDGEVTKTGVGFIYRKSYPTLGDLLRSNKKKNQPKKTAQ